LTEIATETKVSYSNTGRWFESALKSAEKARFVSGFRFTDTFSITSSFRGWNRDPNFQQTVYLVQRK